MTELIENFNKGTVLFKNVVYFLVGIVAIVVFYINTSSHIDNESIHVDRELKMKTEIRLLTIENELITLSNRMDNRYERNKMSQDQIQKDYKEILTKVLDLLTSINKQGEP